MGQSGGLLASLLITGTLISTVFLFVIFGLPRFTTNTSIPGTDGSNTTHANSVLVLGKG